MFIDLKKKNKFLALFFQIMGTGDREKSEMSSIFFFPKSLFVLVRPKSNTTTAKHVMDYWTLLLFL